MSKIHSYNIPLWCNLFGSPAHFKKCRPNVYRVGRDIFGWGTLSALVAFLQSRIKEHLSPDFSRRKIGALGPMPKTRHARLQKPQVTLPLQCLLLCLGTQKEINAGLGFFLTTGGGVISGTHQPQIFGKPPDPQMSHLLGGGGAIGHPPTHHRQNALPQAKCLDQRLRR